MTDLPLVAIAEGADQDDRSDLYLAFRRCSQWQKTTPTNLHLRELLFWVCAVDRDRRGVQVSYDQIADKLELASGRAARGVVQRAEEWGLLEVIEARYQRGGQSANRYRINWPLVRAIRDGIDDGNPWQRKQAQQTKPAEIPTKTPAPVQPTAPPKHEPAPHGPGDAQRHGGDAQRHGGDAQRHPFKECSRTTTRTKDIHSLTTNTPDTPASDWPVVVSEILDLGVSMASEAVDAARARGLSLSDVRGLVGEYRTRSSRGDPVSPGWLYRWLLGKSTPEQPAKPAGVRGGGLTPEQVQAEAIRSRIVKAGRRAGADESEIARRCHAAGVSL
jgi:hypothetical protein